jgi:hypothetical protein
MSNFAHPLVIITWQRMLLKHFHDNSDERFFVLRNYCPRSKKHAAAPHDDLYLGTKDAIKKGCGRQVCSFYCFVFMEELSIVQFTDYILQPDANL